MKDGIIKIADDLTIMPGYSFAQFKITRFYEQQDGDRIIYLDAPQTIAGRRYLVSLFFRNGIIYMVSLVCCDEEYSEEDEPKRKELHDRILSEQGISQDCEYSWGKITSEYDKRGNVSSINIYYK